MSKIALPIAELKPALTGLGKVVSKRSTLPVLSHLKIERTKDGWIALTGTDLDAFVTIRLEQPSDGEPISMLVPYDELLKITKNCPKTDSILIKSEEKPAVTIQYAIGSQVAETKVDSLPVEEFPEIPRIKGESVPLNDAVRQSIHEAIECASTDETRYILRGAYIDVSKQNAHYVVGTDGRHLFSSNSFNLPMKDSIIIPEHKFLGFKEFNNDGEWQLRAPKPKDENTWFQISSRRWRFITRQIEGNYPNLRQVVPSPDQFNTRLEFESIEKLTRMIERMPCADAVNLTVGLEMIGKKVSLISRAPNADNWTKVEVQDVKTNGKDVTIHLNRHLLIKALQFGLNTVEIIDAMSPMRLSNEGRQMIIMPIRADSPAPTPTAAPQAQETAPQPSQEERTPMVNDPTEQPTIDQVIVDVEAMRTTVQDHLTELKSVCTKLKAIQREHKTGNKELQSIRQTLKGLQGMKL